jgi:hypothetical protein
VVTDAQGCESAPATGILTVNALPTAVISDSTNPNCPLDSNGNATVLASGGTPGYNYLWSGGLGPTLPTVSGLTAGTYSVTVTDDNGCESTISVTLEDPDAISASIDAFTNTTCFGAGDGTITVTASGGTPGYNISWDGDTIPGAVAYWPLDETSGTNANDYSGNNHNGILQPVSGNGPTVNQTGQYGTAYSFDAINDRIYVENSDSINLILQLSNRSYSLNFKANDVVTRQVIYEEGAHVNGLNIYILNNKLYAGAYSTSNGWAGEWVDHPILPNTWYSVVFVFSNSGDLELYVDGVSVATYNGGGSAIRIHSGLIGIGAMIQRTVFHDNIATNVSPDDHYFSGSIDDIGIWNSIIFPR